MNDVVVVIGGNIDIICVCVIVLDLSVCICVIQIVFILCPWLIWLIFVSINLREMRLIAIDNNNIHTVYIKDYTLIDVASCAISLVLSDLA